MARSTARKAERMHLRLSPKTKKRIELAAELSGRTITDFVVSSIAAKAEEIIEYQRLIKLSQRDSEIFYQAILNPPEPNAALKKAFKHYQELNSQ